MNWLKHILISFLFASLYSLFFGLNTKAFLIVIFGAIPMDIDHLVNDITKGRIKNPRKMLKRWYKTADIYTGEFHFLHNIEILFTVFLLALYSKIFYYLFISFTLHLAADYYMKVRHTKSFSINGFSIILHILNKKKHKK